jgi:hypothetical protein
MNETHGDFKKKMVRDDPLPTIKDIEREMDKETQFNNEYFLSKENIKAATIRDHTQTQSYLCLIPYHNLIYLF